MNCRRHLTVVPQEAQTEKKELRINVLLNTMVWMKSETYKYRIVDGEKDLNCRLCDQIIFCLQYTVSMKQ